MGFFAALFNWRPEVDSQNTGRAVYVRPVGLANVTVNGAGGFAYNQSLSPFNPSSTNRRNVTKASLTGKGNAFNTDPLARPLSDLPELPQDGRLNSNAQV